MEISSELEREGKIRLSLIDVMYGVIMGYGFNFFVDRDPTDVTLVLFIFTILTIVSDWLFVHKPYWRSPEFYSNTPFFLDLIILLNFAFMIRFAVKEPNNALLMCLATVFLLYAIWDFLYRIPLKKQGRLWYMDLIFDASAGLLYFILWKFSTSPFLAKKLFEIDLPAWVGFDVEIQRWTAIAIIIYTLFGPHPVGDAVKGGRHPGL
jgi:hypothetical protein